MDATLFTDAAAIAKRDLRACYVPEGIVAGLHHFDDFWARDALFASFGSLAIGDSEIVRKVLKLFLAYQRSDGLIPRRINRYYVPELKYISPLRWKRKNLKPIFTGRYGFESLDANALLLIVAKKYLDETHDTPWIEQHIDSLLRALQWLKSQDIDHDDLVEEGGLSNWMDTELKFRIDGKTMYTNVLTWQALESGAQLCKAIKKEFPRDLNEWRVRSAEKIKSVFWNGNYFIDYIHNQKKYEYYATDGNVLAMVFDLAETDKQRQILRYRDTIFTGLSTTNYPSYPASMLAFQNVMFDLPGYQNNYAIWIWLVALEALAQEKNGEREKAIATMVTIAHWIVAGRGVYEVYHPDGNPYHRKMWKSDAPFAWSSGIFLYALSMMGLVPASFHK